MAPGGITCRALFVPDSEACLAVVRGALQELTIPYNWTKYGALTPDESAALFVDMFNSFCFAEGPCRMIGEIIAFAGTVSPKPNWLLCNGAEVAQATYPDLYAVIGDTYGAASVGNFLLPDLRGRSLSGFGSGPGLNPIDVGQRYGEQSHILSTDEIPAHNHADTGHQHTTGNSATGVAVTPGELPVLVPNPIPALTGSASANITNTGGGSGHNTIGPRLGIMYLIVAKDG
jgi:microcystin-dependent protein